MTYKPNYKKGTTPEQYEVCLKKATEPAFSGEYYDCKHKGIYKCICCGNNLFASDTKFGSGTGWPSFWTPINEESVKEGTDKSYDMLRTEVMSAKCGANLVRVFDER
jgi:peptide-methionine (R)-S-oxide reductase